MFRVVIFCALLVAQVAEATTITPTNGQVFNGNQYTAPGDKWIRLGTQHNVTFINCAFSGGIVSVEPIAGPVGTHLRFESCTFSRKLIFLTQWNSTGSVTIHRCTFQNGQETGLHLKSITYFRVATFTVTQSVINSAEVALWLDSIQTYSTTFLFEDTNFTKAVPSSYVVRWTGTTFSDTTIIFRRCRFAQDQAGYNVFYSESGTTFQRSNLIFEDNTLIGGLNTFRFEGSFASSSLVLVGNTMSGATENGVEFVNPGMFHTGANLTLAYNKISKGTGNYLTGQIDFASSGAPIILRNNTANPGGAPITTITGATRSLAGLVNVEPGECNRMIDCFASNTVSVSGTAPSNCTCTCRVYRRGFYDARCALLTFPVTPTASITVTPPPTSTSSQTRSRTVVSNSRTLVSPTVTESLTHTTHDLTPSSPLTDSASTAPTSTPTSSASLTTHALTPTQPATVTPPVTNSATLVSPTLTKSLRSSTRPPTVSTMPTLSRSGSLAQTASRSAPTSRTLSRLPTATESHSPFGATGTPSASRSPKPTTTLTPSTSVAVTKPRIFTPTAKATVSSGASPTRTVTVAAKTPTPGPTSRVPPTMRSRPAMSSILLAEMLRTTSNSTSGDARRLWIEIVDTGGGELFDVGSAGCAVDGAMVISPTNEGQSRDAALAFAASLNSTAVAIEMQNSTVLSVTLPPSDAPMRLEVDAELIVAVSPMCLSFRSQGAAFNVTIRRPQPRSPAPLTPAPPTPVLTVVQQNTKTSTAVIVTSAGLAGGGVAGAQLARSSMALSMLDCEPSNDDFDISQAPLAFEIDGVPASKFITGSFMNHVIIGGIFVLQRAAAFVYSRIRKIAMDEALRVVRAPSLMVFPVLLFLEPTVSCAFVTMIYAEGGVKSIGAISLIICCAFPVATFLHLRHSWKAEYVENWDDPSAQSAMDRFFSGSSKWVDRRGDPAAFGFVTRHRLFIDDYNGQHRLFLVAEMAMCIVTGVLGGLKLGAGKCSEILIVTVIVFAAFLALLVFLRPFAAPFLFCFAVLMTSLQLLTAIFVTVRVQTEAEEYERYAEVTTMVAMYILCARSIFDMLPLMRRVYFWATGRQKSGGGGGGGVKDVEEAECEMPLLPDVLPGDEGHNHLRRSLTPPSPAAADVDSSLDDLMTLVAAQKAVAVETSDSESLDSLLLQPHPRDGDDDQHNDDYVEELESQNRRIDGLIDGLLDAQDEAQLSANRAAVDALEALSHSDLLAAVLHKLRAQQRQQDEEHTEGSASVDGGGALALIMQIEAWLERCSAHDDDSAMGLTDASVEGLAVALRGVGGLEALVLRQRMVDHLNAAKLTTSQGTAKAKSRAERELDAVLDALENDDNEAAAAANASKSKRKRFKKPQQSASKANALLRRSCESSSSSGDDVDTQMLDAGEIALL